MFRYKYQHLIAAFLLAVTLQPALNAASPYDPPATYYNSATGTGATLKNQLQTIMTNGHIQRSYGDFRYSASITDADPDHPGNILLVYDRASVSGVWNQGGNLPWNREHVWPQSLQPGSAKNSTKGNLGDPHALRPADTQINSNRGHRAFGFENTSGAHGTIGSNYYYPGDADRGDIARQLFYSTTRYASSNLTLVEGSPSTNEMGDFSSLLAWHYLDVPDDFELRRNHAIYSSALNPSYYTNNRNAYIDRPEYVWSVFVDQQNDSRITLDGTTVNSDGSSTLELSLGRVLVGAAVPSTQTVTLNKNGNDGTYYSVNTTGSATSSLDGRNNAFKTGGSDSTNFQVGLNGSTASAGQRNGSVTVNNLDVTTAGGTGRGANDANDTIDLTLDVLDHAHPSFASDRDLDSLTIDFGTHPLGGKTPTIDLDIFNLESTVNFTASLELDSIFVNGDSSTFTTDLALFSGTDSLSAGDATSFAISLETSTIGSFEAIYSLSFSDENLPGASDLGQLELVLSGMIVEPNIEDADFDSDGNVTASDFLVWQRGFSVGSSLGEGDANGDSSVDGSDLTIWQEGYGTNSVSAAGSVSVVPEPSSLGLLLCWVMATLQSCTYRQSRTG